MLERVERVTTDVIVAERLKTWIIDNQLQPGDRLPTEQQLCGELGVARHTLREGIQRLAQLGIVESRTGSGMYISNMSFDNMAEYMLFLKQRGDISVDDICNVRSVLECYVARTVALVVDDAHIRQLHVHLENMKARCDENDWENYVQEDITFHLCLADASDNQLLSGVICALRRIIRAHMSSLDRKTALNSYKQHCLIVDAIERHNPDLAAERMREHLAGIQGSYIS